MARYICVKGSLGVIAILFTGGFIMRWLSPDVGIPPVALQLLQQRLFSTLNYAQNTRNIREHLLRACEMCMSKYVDEFGDYFGHARGLWYVSNNFKLINCQIRKVGSSNIARVLYILENITDHTNPNFVKPGFAKKSILLVTNNTTEEAFGPHYEEYKKFLFVRDPLERLVSAYRDRKPLGWFLGKQRTFSDYLEMIVSQPDRKTNLHMASFTRVCNPCGIKYDFVGHVDNYEEDLRQLIELVGVNSNIGLPKRNQTGYKQSKSSTVLTEYLKDVPKSLIHKVYEQYYWDYFLFGFLKPDF